MMEFPIPNTGQDAIYQYLIEHLIENQGRPPALRDFIRDEVGSNTSAGPITSTSVLTHNLNALESLGLIEFTGDWHHNRRIRVKGGIFAMPANVLHRTPISDYLVVAFDDSSGIYKPVNPATALLMESVGKNHDVVVLTTTHEETLPDILEIQKINVNVRENYVYMAEDTPADILEYIVSEWDIMHSELAIVTRHPDVTIAAIALGCGVFEPPAMDIGRNNGNGN